MNSKQASPVPGPKSKETTAGKVVGLVKIAAGRSPTNWSAITASSYICSLSAERDAYVGADVVGADVVGNEVGISVGISVGDIEIPLKASACRRKMVPDRSCR